MDTQQKNREAARKRRPQQSGQRRPAAEEKQAAQQRRTTAQKNTTAAKRPGQQTPQRQRPTQQRSAEQPAQRQRAGERRTSRQRTAQHRDYPDDGIKRSAPQGAHQQRSSRQGTAPQRKPQPKPEAQKRTVKQNSLQNFIAGLKTNTAEKSGARAEQAEARRKARAAKAEKKRKQAARSDAPAVIYTQPAAFNRNRLLIQLLTVTAIVVALVMGMSVFFKVGTITVSGAEVYSAWAVREASGIKEGDSLLTFSRQRATAQIQAKLPYVEKSRIGIKLPETVIIYIEEMDVAYAIKSSDGVWWLMTSSGRMVEQINAADAENYTQVLGVTVENPKSNEDAVATENTPAGTDASDETGDATEAAPVTVTGAQRLHSALQILQALEANDIVGEAASVNVSRLEDIILWYGSRYQVNLGDTSRMEYKIAYMNGAILQMSDYQSGILDVSFTHWPDQAGYTPFE